MNTPVQETAAQQAQDAAVIAKGAGVNLLGSLAKVIKSTLFIFLTRLFGAEIFGLYILAWSVIDLVSKIGSFGFDKAILKFVVQHRTDRNEQAVRRTMGQTFALGLMVSGAISILVYYAAPGISETLFEKPAMTGMLRMLAWTVPFLTLTTLGLAATKSLKIMRYDAYVKSIAEPLLMFAAAWAALFIGWRHAGIAFAHLVAVTGGALVTLTIINRYYGLRACLHQGIRGIRFWSDLTRFSLPVMGYDLVYILMMRLDALMVGYFLPAVQVGIYAIAIEVALTTKKVRQWFDPIFAPIISELNHKNERERLGENFALVTRWVLTINLAFFFGMMLFGKDVLLLFGPTFAAGALSLVLLSLSQVIYASMGSGDNLLILSGHPYLNLINTALVLVVNFVLGLALIPVYGMAGAALGTLLAFALLSVIRIIEVYRRLGIHPFRRVLWKPCCASLLAFGVGYMASAWLPERGLWRAVPLAAVFLAVYGALLVWFELEAPDRMVWQRIRRKLGWRSSGDDDARNLRLSA